MVMKVFIALPMRAECLVSKRGENLLNRQVQAVIFKFIFTRLESAELNALTAWCGVRSMLVATRTLSLTILTGTSRTINSRISSKSPQGRTPPSAEGQHRAITALYGILVTINGRQHFGLTASAFTWVCSMTRRSLISPMSMRRIVGTNTTNSPLEKTSASPVIKTYKPYFKELICCNSTHW